MAPCGGARAALLLALAPAACLCFIQAPMASLPASQGLRSARRNPISLRACQEPRKEGEGVGRRSAIQVLGAGILAAATPAGAFCPPNCRPDEGAAPIEGLTAPIDLDKSGVAKSLKEKALRPASDPEDPEDVRIDLSTPQGQALAKETDRAFFDVQVGENGNTTRIVIALYGEIVPQTVKNFKMLCTGEKGFGYKGTEFFRIVQGLQVSAGDVLANQGRSGKSAINEGTFPQENFKLMHSVPYVVSMTNTLQKEVDSRFFISTRPEVDLGYSKIFDGKYVAFGRVVKGIDAVQALDSLETRSGKGINSGRPKLKVVIKDCGILPKS